MVAVYYTVTMYVRMCRFLRLNDNYRSGVINNTVTSKNLSQFTAVYVCKLHGILSLDFFSPSLYMHHPYTCTCMYVCSFRKIHLYIIIYIYMYIYTCIDELLYIHVRTICSTRLIQHYTRNPLTAYDGKLDTPLVTIKYLLRDEQHFC